MYIVKFNGLPPESFRRRVNAEDYYRRLTGWPINLLGMRPGDVKTLPGAIIRREA